MGIEGLMAFVSALALWLFYAGMMTWGAGRTSRGESWRLLAWGHLMRVGALWSLLATVYFAARWIGGCQ